MSVSAGRVTLIVGEGEAWPDGLCSLEVNNDGAGPACEGDPMGEGDGEPDAVLAASDQLLLPGPETHVAGVGEVDNRAADPWRADVVAGTGQADSLMSGGGLLGVVGE